MWDESLTAAGRRLTLPERSGRTQALLKRAGGWGEAGICPNFFDFPANILMTRKLAMVSINGQIKENTKDGGMEVNSMA